MSARLRRLLAAALVLAVAGLAAAPSAAAAPAQGSAVEDFTSCLNTTRTGDVLLLVDESSSLRATDPQAARATAARFLLSRLTGVADATGYQLSAQVAGFSDTFAPASGWTPLTGAGLPTLSSTVDGFAGRTGGFETDYATALEGARRSLADQQAAHPGRRCQAVAWFSDGRLEITPRATDADREAHGATKPYDSDRPLGDEPAADRAEAAARDALCRPRGGLADQLRASGVVTFGIGLDAGARPGDFDLMSAVTTGSAPGGTGCGSPTTRPVGEFHLASDIGDLLFAFDALVPPGPPLPGSRPDCPGTLCEAGRHAFVLDPSVARVEVLGSVDRAGAQALLVPPSGPPIPVGTTPQASTIAAGAAVVSSSRPSERTVSVALTSPSRGTGWSGEWALVFVDPPGTAPPGTSRTQLRIVGDLLPAWRNRPPVLHAGDRVPASYGLRDGAGRDVPAIALPGQAALSAVLTAGAPVTVAVAPDKSAIGAPVTLDLSGVAPGPATLRLELDQRTADTVRADGTPVAGTPMTPQSVELPLEIAPPAGYPQVAGSLAFGTGDGGTSLTAELPIAGPGCVWVPPQSDPPLAAAPADAGRVTVSGVDATGAAGCTPLAPGQSGTVAVRLDTEHPGDGTASGTFTVMAAPGGEPAAATPVTVAFDADLRRPFDPVDGVAAFLAALVLGVAVPVGLLYLARFVTARVPASGLFAARVEVTVRDGAVARDGRELAVGDRELAFVSVEHPRRPPTVCGVRMRVRQPAWPLRPPRVLAGVDDEGTRAASSEGSAGDDAVLPLAIQNTWLVLHRRGEDPGRAELLVTVGAGAAAGTLARLLADAARHLPAVLARLCASDPGPAASSGSPPPGRYPPPGPFGGPPPGPYPPARGPAGPRSPFDFDPAGPGPTSRRPGGQT